MVRGCLARRTTLLIRRKRLVFLITCLVRRWRMGLNCRIRTCLAILVGTLLCGILDRSLVLCRVCRELRATLIALL